MRRSARGSLWAGTAEVAQAGLMGCGLLALAWLTTPWRCAWRASSS
jgi:hypothetical protein